MLTLLMSFAGEPVLSLFVAVAAALVVLVLCLLITAAPGVTSISARNVLCCGAEFFTGVVFAAELSLAVSLLNDLQAVNTNADKTPVKKMIRFIIRIAI